MKSFAVVNEEATQRVPEAKRQPVNFSGKLTSCADKNDQLHCQSNSRRLTTARNAANNSSIETGNRV